MNTRQLKNKSVMEEGLAQLTSVFQHGSAKRRIKFSDDHPALDILSYYSSGLSGEQISMSAKVNGSYDFEKQMDILFASSGIMYRRIMLNGKWWKEVSEPIIAKTNDGEYIALLPQGDAYYEYVEPQTRQIARLNKNNAKLFNNAGYSFFCPLEAKSLTVFNVLGFSLKAVRTGDVLLFLVYSLLIASLGLFTPFVYQQIFSIIIPSGDKASTVVVAVLLTGSALGTALFNISHALGMARVSGRMCMRLESAVMMRVLKLPARFFGRFNPGDMANRVFSVEVLSHNFCDVMLRVVLTFIFSLVYIVQMAVYAPECAQAVVLTLCAMFTFSMLLFYFQHKTLNQTTEYSSKLYGVVTELLSGITKIKLVAAEEDAFLKWADKQSRLARAVYSPPMVMRINRSFIRFLAILGSALTYYFAAKSSVTISNYIAFNAAFSMGIAAFISLAESAPVIASLKPLYDMIKPILIQEPEDAGEVKRIAERLNGDIEVSNLSFRYDSDSPYILSDLSFHVSPGESIAITGTSGCGKTTLMKLLLGFYKPERGSILYDGQNLSELDIQSVRRLIGTCMQNSALFSDDIYSNIVVAAPWKGMEDAWRAAELAGIKEEIEAMPMRMHTIIAEGGHGVSGGQRQRILIARALVSEPQIIFMDEATSALDNVTQKHVTDAIGTLSCTRIIIAHRLSTIASCDRILVLDKGRLKESGTYDELIEKRGLFWQLARHQMSQGYNK